MTGNGPASMPAPEQEVTADLARRLLAEQHPDLVGLELVEVANGWDNVILRLGSSYSLRLPRREAGGQLVRHEQRWLPGLAERLPVPVPAPVRVGRPGLGYPWHWSVTPWFPGAVAAEAVLGEPARDAQYLGGFLGALHQPAPVGAPVNPHRGVHVADLCERVERNLAVLDGQVDSAGCRDLWAEVACTPEWAQPPVWVHGDLHTANIVVADGAISAVIDFGDICGGDPAVDLAVGWMLFDESARRVFREAAGGTGPVDDDTWARARAWALHFALTYLANSADAPRMAGIGRSLLTSLGV